MIYLGVNIDHVATLREARGEEEPDVLETAQTVKKAGGDSITIHLREDRRHIQDTDVSILRKKVSLPLNLEMALSEDIIRIALRIVPDQITLVPEKRKELTTEGGLNVLKGEKRIARAIACFKKKGIETSLFIEPQKKHIAVAARCGVDAVEFHTGRYAHAFKVKKHSESLQRLHDAALYAHAYRLRVHAGHGLNYKNVNLICALPFLYELNIGHAIVSYALFYGMQKAVSDMRKIIDSAEQTCEIKKLKKK